MSFKEELEKQGMGVLISVDAPYSRMIIEGYKLMEFRKKIVPYLKMETDNSKTVVLYIYETKRNGGSGLVVGQVTCDCVYSPLYTKKIKTGEDCTSHVKERFVTIRDLYLNWCLMKKIKPNMNEGWFSSKKFTKYKNEIGWNTSFNYALRLSNGNTYKVPLDLSGFLKNQGEVISRAPKNMAMVVIKMTIKEDTE